MGVGKRMSKLVTFYHRALSDPYEEQAREQGYTLGDDAELLQKLGFWLVLCHIHGVLTDSQYDKALQKLNKKIVGSLKPLEEKK